MGIFENFDQTSWLIFGLIVVAAIAYYFWPETTKADAEVSVDQETRKKAKPLIALADDAADQQLFELSPMPLRILPGGKLKSETPGNDKEIAEALWAKQREMITRLESELDYTQQADVSEHFAIAAPANQPGALLQKTLKGLEDLNGQIAGMLKLPADQKLWRGRILILMLSTRKLFDHVAWLTGAGIAASAPGAFTLWDDNISTIVIYATRVELGLIDNPDADPRGLSSLPAPTKPASTAGFDRTLSLQVCRHAVKCVGGEQTPQWLEYGLAYWMTHKSLGKPELAKNQEPPKWDAAGGDIFDASAWQKASEDSSRLEKLVIYSMLFVERAMTDQSDRILNSIKTLRSSGEGGKAALETWARELCHTVMTV